MAYLVGNFKIKGTIDNASYYVDRNNRCVMRKKRASTRHAFYHSHKYESCRKNVNEFVSGTKIARQIRMGFDCHRPYFSDPDYFNRLVGLMRLIADTDFKNKWGLRNACEGNMHLLEDFSFNKNRSLTEALNADIDVSFDRNTGKYTINIEKFSPHLHINGPDSARWFQVYVRAFHFENYHEKNVITAETFTPTIAVDSKDEQSLSFELQLPVKDAGFYILGLGVVFYENYRGIPVAIRSGGAMNITSVDSAAAPKKDIVSAAELLESQMLSFDNNVKKKGSFYTPMVAGEEDPVLTEHIRKVRRDLWREQLHKYRRG